MKLVKEHINFKRGLDPKIAMGIGRFKLIKDWCVDHNIHNFIINKDFTINVLNDNRLMDMSDSPLRERIAEKHLSAFNRSDTYVNDGRVEIHEEMDKLPNYIQFNEVEGYFSISGCNLTSLRGCPKIIHNNFWCTNNKLSNLKYCPKVVGGSFICHHNTEWFDKDYILSKCKTARSTIQNGR